MARDQIAKECQADFEKYAKQYSLLKAYWSGSSGTWTLWWGSMPSGRDAPQECQDVFKAIAGRAGTKLAGDAAVGHPQPWQRWLDLLRRRKWGFSVTGHTPCTEFEWDAGVRDGRPLVVIRGEQRYSTGDEWEKVYERTQTGELRQLTVEELESKTSEERNNYYHWLENGVIEHVFESSARFCENPARSFEMDSARDGPVHGGCSAGFERLNDEPSRKGRKRGPRRDYERAESVASVVARFPDWRLAVYEVCEALDKEPILPPNKWRAGDKTFRL